MVVPSTVCLKSEYNNKYLCIRDESVQYRKLVKLYGENVLDSPAEFDVECGGTGSVYLRSRNNGKYLARCSPDHYWISAVADEPSDDTVFHIEFNDYTKKAKLVHSVLGRYVSLSNRGAPFDLCLLAGPKDMDCEDLVILVDSALSIPKLPKNVAFIDENNKYLGSFMSNGIPYLQFSFDNPKDLKVAHEVIYSSDGSIHIKSKYFCKFWRLGDNNRIVADVEKSGYLNDPKAIFRPNILASNVVALLNKSNNQYCKFHTTENRPDLLNAANDVDDSQSSLKFVDLGY